MWLVADEGATETEKLVFLDRRKRGDIVGSGRVLGNLAGWAFIFRGSLVADSAECHDLSRWLIEEGISLHS